MPGLSLSTAPRGYVRSPADAAAFWQLGNLWRVLASGHQTGSTFCAIDQLVTAKGGGPGVHLHPSDEGLYVVSGHCTFYAGGTTLSADAGSFIFVPRFTEHAFEVDGPETQLLNFYLPAGFELFIMGFAHPAERNELPSPGEAALPPPRLVEQLSRDFGQIVVPGQPLPATVPPDASQMVTFPNVDAAVPPYLVIRDSAQRNWLDAEIWATLADSARTDGSFSMFDIASPRSAGAPPHSFVGSDLFYYVLDGEAEMLIDDKMRIARRGDFVFVPKGAIHARRTTSATARLLLLISPAGFERIVDLFGQVTQDNVLSDTDPVRTPGLLWRALSGHPTNLSPSEEPAEHPSVDARRAAFMFADLGIRSATAIPLR